MHGIGRHLQVALKGMAMGAADVVPGVSGGTIAFISGIYPTLINSLSAFDGTALRLLLERRWAALAVHINLSFLLALAAGIATSAVTLAGLVSHLLATEPLPVWGFFFGLIAGSVLFLLRGQSLRNTANAGALALGCAIAVAVGMAPPLALVASLPVLFCAGALALCAMILPGISGSFILLLLGLYPTVVGAVAQRDLLVLAVFLAGGAVGLLSFSRLLHYLMARYKSLILMLMSGFLLGSLTIVWPWRHPLGDGADAPRGNLTPDGFAQLYGDPQLLLTGLAMAVGLTVLLAVESYGQRSATRRGGR